MSKRCATCGLALVLAWSFWADPATAVNARKTVRAAYDHIITHPKMVAMGTKIYPLRPNSSGSLLNLLRLFYVSSGILAVDLVGKELAPSSVDPFITAGFYGGIAFNWLLYGAAANEHRFSRRKGAFNALDRQYRKITKQPDGKGIRDSIYENAIEDTEAALKADKKVLAKEHAQKAIERMIELRSDGFPLQTHPRADHVLGSLPPDLALDLMRDIRRIELKAASGDEVWLWAKEVRRKKIFPLDKRVQLVNFSLAEIENGREQKKLPALSRAEQETVFAQLNGHMDDLANQKISEADFFDNMSRTTIGWSDGKYQP